jgi:hypothetical protein
MRELMGRMRRGNEQFLLYVIARRYGALDRSVLLLTHLGGAAATLSTLMLAAPWPVWNEAGSLAAFALVGSHLCVQGLKRSIARARPHLPVGFTRSSRRPTASASRAATPPPHCQSRAVRRRRYPPLRHG